MRKVVQVLGTFMAASAKTIRITKPRHLRRGYYFKTCRPYCSNSGVKYNYRLYNWRGKQLKLQERGWRKMLSFNFTTRDGHARIDIHRVFAFNAGRCNTRSLSWRQDRHVHHHPYPRRRPWTNCFSRNLWVMTAAEHIAWYKRNPDVPDHSRGAR